MKINSILKWLISQRKIKYYTSFKTKDDAYIFFRSVIKFLDDSTIEKSKKKLLSTCLRKDKVVRITRNKSFVYLSGGDFNISVIEEEGIILILKGKLSVIMYFLLLAISIIMFFIFTEKAVYLSILLFFIGYLGFNFEYQWDLANIEHVFDSALKQQGILISKEEFL
jgi:hypothetical protein